MYTDFIRKMCNSLVLSVLHCLLLVLMKMDLNCKCIVNQLKDCTMERFGESKNLCIDYLVSTLILQVHL